MTDWAVHPAWPLLLGAALAALVPRRLRPPLLLGPPAVALVLAWRLPPAAHASATLMGQVILLRGDRLGRVFALVFVLIGALGIVYGLAAPRARLHCAALAATGAAVGIALAGDWVSFYVCWEILAVASCVLITDGGNPRATRAAFRYLLVHFTGGALLLAGLVWHYAAAATPLVGPLPPGGAALLVLTAFAVNAAIPPLHAWLTDAYPESSPAGSVFLSAFATKSAVYALARAFPGVEWLVWAGVVMALYGVIFAVLENNIRRLLAYHIVSQVGYMVAGVGLGSQLAVSGAVAHAFSHILYKGLLFMAAGSVLHATGRAWLPDLGGLAFRMPAVFALYMVGALSISGAPWLNGFVSKSLVVAAAEEEHRWMVAGLLNLAAVGTFLSVGLKLPAFTFGGPRAPRDPAPLPPSMVIAMACTAALCVSIGVAPTLLYRLLPFPVAYQPYTADHVLGTLELLAGTAIGFALLRRWLAPGRKQSVDVDRLYRAVGTWVAGPAARAAGWAADKMEAGVVGLADLSPSVGPRFLPVPLAYSVLLTLVALGVAIVLFLLTT